MDRQHKRELRELNARAWAGDKDVFAVSASLDPSMKKNTAFIKRLRTAISASSTATFLQEIKTLSLNKYLSEIISACYEGLCKVKVPADVPAAVEIFSALHQRFGPEEFTAYIGWLIGRGLSTPEKAQLKALPQEVREREEKERVARHKVLLRVATDLWLVGALRSLDDTTRPEEAGKPKENGRPIGPPSQKAAASGGVRPPEAADAEPFPLEVLKDLLSQDGQHISLPLVVQLVKAFPWDLLGKKIGEDEAIPNQDTPLVDASMQQRFRNILSKYFEGATKHLVRDQTSLNNQSRRNAEAYVRSGEIFEDRQSNFEKQTKNQEKFVANMQVLSEALDIEMPDLKEKESSTAATDGNIGLVKTGEYLKGEGDGAGIWEDEDERRFYENIIDVKDRVPGILLEEPKKKKAEDEPVGKRLDEKAVNGSTEDADKAETKVSDDQSTSIANKTIGAQVDTILVRIPEAMSKDLIDEVAVDFCFVNSKASRNRLVKSLQDSPKGRTDLLPLYARLICTLGKYMPDVPQSVVSHLDEEFRSLQRRKQKDSLGGVRTSNVRYLAELTKFGLVPEHIIFHCFKVCLDDFSRMNIDIMCTLLENCGRYLLRSSETSPRMRSFLETLQRKKNAQHLAQQERMLIENAIYYVNPPERAAIEQKERTPVDLFVRKLVYVDLNKRNLDKISKQIRKLHWEEDEVVEIVRKIFVKPGKMKYSNIHFLAIILGSLNRYHQEFTISVIDDVLEDITLGLEMNDFKYNQKRIAQVKYLGELYVYRMIDSSVVFQTMWKISTFGHSDWTNLESINPLDPPDDFFRVRLVCVLLDTCGSFFEKGAAKKKLDMFLTFFQFYIQTKDRIPMDISFLVHDTFAQVRPQWKLAVSLEEAGNLFVEALKEEGKNGATAQQIADPVEQDEQDEVDDENDDGGNRTPDEQEDNRSSGDEAEAIEDNQNADLDSSSDEGDEDEDEENEVIVVKRPEDERDPEADAEFDRELAKLMAEGLETRKTERRQVHEVALPMRRAQLKDATAAVDSGDEGPQQTSNTIKFSLLSKKGNRPQTRAIDLPADSNFAIAMRTQQEAEKAEQQRIKELVLNYDMQKNEDEDEAANGESNTFSYISPLEPNLNRLRPITRKHNAPVYTQRAGRTDRRYGALSEESMPLNSTRKENSQANMSENDQGTSLDRHYYNSAPRDGFGRLGHYSHGSLDSGSKGRRQGDGSGPAGTGKRGQARKLQLSDVNW